MVQPSNNQICAIVFSFALALLTNELLAQSNDEVQALPIFDTFLNIEESFENSVEQASQKVLTAPDGSKPVERLDEPRSTRRYSVEIPGNTSNRAEVQAIRRKMQEAMRKYLEWYRGTKLPSPGIEKVKPDHLNPWLLKYRRGSVYNSRTKEFVLIFDEKFEKHVRARGLQLQLMETRRFPTLGYVAVSVFAGLLLTYGALKLANRRSSHDDYLSSSEISMV